MRQVVEVRLDAVLAEQVGQFARRARETPVAADTVEGVPVGSPVGPVTDQVALLHGAPLHVVHTHSLFLLSRTSIEGLRFNGAVCPSVSGRFLDRSHCRALQLN